MTDQTLNNCINNILSYERRCEKTINDLVEKNASLTKALANIRSLLEKSLKQNSLLNNAVYESINICRSNLHYLDYSSGKNKTDLLLSENEKTLPNSETLVVNNL